VAMPGNVMLFCRDSDRLAVVHSCVQLLEPGGLLIAGFSCDRSLSVAQYDELCAACDLTLVHRWATWERAPFRDGDYVVSVHSRDSRFNVHDALAAARSTIHRLSPAELTERLAGEHPPTVVDTRTDTDRRRSGSIPGSIHMPSTVLQWRLDPASGYRHPAAIPLDQPVVVVCNHGYSSSMAAAALTSIGFENVSDLVGGMAAWIAAGGPVHPADGSPARG
ncbi:MAG: putative rhodanese, partial [Ilumatobacteraceae bacterium]|nr:putative rhodanese [Ilumatobacteraceae bacterium]